MQKAVTKRNADQEGKSLICNSRRYNSGKEELSETQKKNPLKNQPTRKKSPNL